MTITTKGRYALRILLDLAQQDPEAIGAAERHCEAAGNLQ